VGRYGSTLYGGGSSESDPPVIANATYPNSRTGFFECDIHDAVGLASVTILVSLGNAPNVWIAAYADGRFQGAFAAYSTVSGAGTPASPLHFRVRPAAGWPAGTNTVRPRAIDTSGNVAT
jgi:hypothetical protein